MPTPMPAGLKLGVVEPKDAIAAFKRRGDLLKSFRWQDVWQEEHARGFAVAGVSQLDVLGAFQSELDQVLVEGGSLADFAGRIRPRLVKAGFWGEVEVADPKTGELRTTRFDERRLQLIFDVNLRQSYAAGRWARIERNKASHPFVMYRTMNDEHVRASHKPWHGLVLPVEHEFWQTHFPPNGWRCRCTAFAVSEKDIARYQAAGQPVNRVAPAVHTVDYVNPYTGEVKPVPRGIDPGFGYNPGRVHATSGAKLLGEALGKAAPDVGAQAGLALAETLAPQAQAAWRTMVDGTARTMRAQGDALLVHVIKPDVMAALLEQPLGRRPASAAVWMRDADLLHALRDSKKDRGAGLSVDAWRALPELLDQAQAFFDTEDPALVYAVEIPGATGKIVVRINYSDKMRQGSERIRWTTNFVRTGGIVEPADLVPPRYMPLNGA